MTIRIDVDALAAEIRDSLDRGEPVEFELDGEVVARIDPPARTGDPWTRYFELRRAHGPVDDEFEKDLAEARRMLNTPVTTDPWD